MSVPALADQAGEARLGRLEIGTTKRGIGPAYQDKVALVAETGIFDKAALRQVIADRIAAWDLAGEAELWEFINT